MAELTVPTLDFTALGNLGADYKKQQADAVTQQTLAQLGKTADGKINTAPLYASGNMQLAQLGMQIDNTQHQQDREVRTDAHQAAQDVEHKREFGMNFGLQQRAADRADEDKYAVKDVTDANGNTTFVKYNTRTGDVVPTGPQPSSSTQNNPFSTGGKFNGDQGKAAGFTDRMLQSEGILSGVGPGTGTEGPPSPGVQNQGADIAQTGMSKIPGVGNFLVSGDRQKYNQAKSDFINAQLRRESGAAIAQSEFDNADKQYFPVPGDSAEVIRQKAANRRASIQAMGREGGPSYKPKYNFGDDGGVVAYGSPAPVNNQNTPGPAPVPAATPAPPAAPSTAPIATPAPPPPQVGQLMGGYRFKGGNPADPASWIQSQ